MEKPCVRCRFANRARALFCARCGLSLGLGVDGTVRAGSVREGQSAAVPPGFLPVADAAHLYFQWESSLGGQVLIGTEGLRVTVFNAGYPLREVVLNLIGLGRENEEVFSIEETIREIARGERGAVEVPSYRMDSPMRVLMVRLVSAEFAPR